MWKRFSFALLAMASLTGSYAQQAGLAADSVSVFTLMEEIEKGTAYQVYTTLSQPFLVKRPLGLTPVDALKESLKGTSWQVNVYGNRIYLMQNLTLQSTLPKAWQQSLTVQEENHPVYVPEVMTSENKIYEVGDKYKPSKKKQIKLTGQVIDFRSESPLVGIHVIRREPWMVVTTDHEGRFSMDLTPGYHVLELQGVNIKEARRQFML